MTSSQSSPVRAAIPALVSVFTAANVSDVQVAEGRLFDPKVHHLLIGWDGANNPAVEAQRNPGDLGLAQNMDVISVRCWLSFWSGSELNSDVRDDALQAFDAYDAALRADHTLDGACIFAEITSYSYTPVLRTEGCCVAVAFTVTIRGMR